MEFFKKLFGKKKKHTATKDETIAALKDNVKQLQGLLKQAYANQEVIHNQGIELGRAEGIQAILIHLEKTKHEVAREAAAIQRLFEDM